MRVMAFVPNPAKADQINAAFSGNLQNVVRWSSAALVLSVGASAAITVAHDLGTLPNVLHVEPWVDSRWWADTNDRQAWTDKTVTFHVSAASGQFSVRAGIR